MSKIRPISQGQISPVLRSELDEIANHMRSDAIVVADMLQQDSPLVWFSEKFAAITGYSEAEAFGKNCRYLQGSDRLQPEIQIIHSAIRDCKAVTVTIRNYRKDGTLFWNELTLAPHINADGINDYYVGLIRDVTVSKESTAKLASALKNDQLTGLLNRTSFAEEVDGINLPEGHRLMVVKLDIAALYQTNITFGYSAGDDVIRKMATRLKLLVPDAIGRVGSNEFALAFSLPPTISEDTVLLKIATTMRSRLAIPDAIISVRYALGYSVGNPNTSRKDLIQEAGYAVHECKSDKARAPRRYNAIDVRNEAVRSRTTSELQQAIRDGDFIYHYQPQFDMKSQRIVGVEALLRWNHPVFGLQFPDKFIAIAEESGLIINIERQGILQVADFAAKVNNNRSSPLVFAVNISPLEISQGNLEVLINEAINTTGINPAHLTLELTESLLTEGGEDTINLFHRLRALGVGLAIDDFGTGYSSLRSISRFPISEIKIDRSFTQKISDGGLTKIIIETILSLGQELGVRVVAEGIETEKHLSTLNAMGCRIGQGYFFSRPVPAEQLFDLLAAENLRP